MIPSYIKINNSTWSFYPDSCPCVTRAGNRMGRVNSRLGQNRAGPKLARFFRAKILTTQPALKTGLIGPNSLLKVKKNRSDRVNPGHTEPSHIGPGQIWPVFFQANNLIAQPGPNSG